MPVTFLLGGTQPALLRAAVRDPVRAAHSAGQIVGANTVGALLGVAAAVLLIPSIGLRASVLGAGALAMGVGLVAVGLARGALHETGERTAAAPAREKAPPVLLLVAALAGVATIAYEVLAVRIAVLRLGSSLYAWAAVLGLFLASLALGNL